MGDAQCFFGGFTAAVHPVPCDGVEYIRYGDHAGIPG